MNGWMMQNILGKLAVLLCYGKLILYDIWFCYISKECMWRLCQARRFMKASLQAAEMTWTVRNRLYACRAAEWFETVGTNAWQALESRANAERGYFCEAWVATVLSLLDQCKCRCHFSFPLIYRAGGQAEAWVTVRQSRGSEEGEAGTDQSANSAALWLCCLHPHL